ncbi:radical SAM protein [Celeribacter neptunius]|uniref:4Fe-4S single cluster domain-containing protein n=1 Tax=Celeribacter neptunius TaxID=588602 RepID=A0A1I3KSD9_9RHOB|nr:radical SAM protein [Celeribacter neptunius]SFI75376.1 4Fe-4S single cluster domain-containing protein [Celeribacter neptunius]
MKDHDAIPAPHARAETTPANQGKFQHPEVTAKGETRATVALNGLQTLWFNTGTLCNITCVNCYIDSSPSNDALTYLSTAEVETYLDELHTRKDRPREIAFTGGEPFMNPEMIQMARAALTRGYELLILTNAMRPMQRPQVQEGLIALNRDFPEKLTLRVSLDHFAEAHHDEMRGAGSYRVTLAGMDWLRDHGIPMAVAARSLWHDSEAETRAGFAALFAERRYEIDAENPGMTVIFPEMDLSAEVPEITTACWGILGKDPKDVMCASSRMVVKRKGQRPSVVACTLLPYEAEFDLGATLEEASRDVALNHPHCAKFCVLGGASCSV